MPVIKFHLVSSLSVAELVGVLTDFTPNRPLVWPTIDEKHFVVHQLGEDWAEVTEGTESAWERARYEWYPSQGRVVVTTLDSKVFGPGGGWVFECTATDGGTRVDVELTRRPEGLGRRLLAALLPLIAPKSLKKAFAGPLKAK
ncbi:hypothetical protein [Amycolatopsis benzoatilytica]|uniref:hypothetical protein n=1 Tax=Amycolatopsis benzoatilytica TaxID=346045 RepID=UPI00037DC13F|nr:hypothetical protein [Amycolatopsis benzoatilytica]